MISIHSTGLAALAALALAACGDRAGELTEIGAPDAGPPQTAPDGEDMGENIEAARAAAKALGGRLTAELLASLRDEGTTAAIAICADAAPGIARDVSQETGVEVGRTALRARNPDNAADPWERAQLEAFITALAAGGDPAAMERWAVVDNDAGAPVFRWMKPIVMGEPCETCHGTDIADDVTAAVLARYPEDVATGFTPGEIRGAFTVSKPLRTAD